MQEKIISADLVVSEDLKCMNNKNQYQFAYKLNPLPLNPTVNQKKRKTNFDKDEDENDEAMQEKLISQSGMF